VPQKGQDEYANVAEGVDGVRDPLCNVGEETTHRSDTYPSRCAS
jgi:hypothetical protein